MNSARSGSRAGRTSTSPVFPSRLAGDVSARFTAGFPPRLAGGVAINAAGFFVPRASERVECDPARRRDLAGQHQRGGKCERGRDRGNDDAPHRGTCAERTEYRLCRLLCRRKPHLLALAAPTAATIPSHEMKEMPENIDWRSRGDSNPRYGLTPHNGLAIRTLCPGFFMTSPCAAMVSHFSNRSSCAGICDGPALAAAASSGVRNSR